MPSTAAILRMQDYWVDYFHFASEKLTSEQLFDLSIAKEARERLDHDHPFGQ
jgi:NitT/TauT family transport system substrate-binding protein